MGRKPAVKFDEIGYWSEIKLDIIKKYAEAYSTIFNAERQRGHKLHHLYIDAFSGAGIHISKTTREPIQGSPLNILQVHPPFREYHFIDLDSKKLNVLKKAVGDRSDVHFYEGDCNSILLSDLLPKVKYENYRRALCLLDPYGLHLDWKVIQKAGEMGTLDMFLNFPIADMNRNVLWRDPEAKGIRDSDIQRMNSFWPDDEQSWRKIAYTTDQDLFGFPRKEENETIALAFCDRLKKKAGFKYVPKPLPMRNSRGAVVYYLIFASHKPVAHEIVEQIFTKYRNRRS